ncbi:MAG: hypothetical protein WCA63_02210 [Gallionella sp.]
MAVKAWSTSNAVAVTVGDVGAVNVEFTATSAVAEAAVSKFVSVTT